MLLPLHPVSIRTLSEPFVALFQKVWVGERLGAGSTQSGQPHKPENRSCRKADSTGGSSVGSQEPTWSRPDGHAARTLAWLRCPGRGLVREHSRWARPAGRTGAGTGVAESLRCPNGGSGAAGRSGGDARDANSWGREDGVGWRALSVRLPQGTRTSGGWKGWTTCRACPPNA